MNKIYTAFVSSAFNSLRDERNKAIDALLDFRILPIGMEHFTVSTNGEFSDIQELIDESDFFVMLLGKYYGSCDEGGRSWTRREYEYAIFKKKPVIAIICDELIPNFSADMSTLSEQERKQVEFAREVGFARAVSEEFDIKTIIKQFLATYNFSKCVGWSRVEDTTISDAELAAWREENNAYNIGGLWHHVHLNESDETYIRIGTVTIQQDFSPGNYGSIQMKGRNYSVAYYDTATNTFKENKMKSSEFVGEYTLQGNGEIFGIYNSKRAFNGEFKSLEVNKGSRRGIHDFRINVYDSVTECIEGEFHDEAPSPKMGRIFLFRSIEERNSFLLDVRADVIEKR